jgi:hypothetical protein
MRRLIAWIAVLLAITGCEADPLSPVPDARFVVQAFLYAGEPVTDVRITAVLPLGAADSVAPPINHAQVTLRKEGIRYVLLPTPGNAGFYHYAGEDLTVAVGDTFDLEVAVDGVTASGRTTVPPPPDSVRVSSTELRVDGFFAAESVVVRWENPERNWYFITHRNVEDDPEPIFEGTIFIRPGLILSEPTAADSAEISRLSLRHFGRYEVRVHRVNAEYERLYMSRRQDTRDLNEPASNIANGLGIFTAFSSRSAFFLVSD